MSEFLPERGNLDDSAPVQCDNCDWAGTLAEVEIIEDAEQRLDVGSVVPAGECPVCGTLAYLVK